MSATDQTDNLGAPSQTAPIASQPARNSRASSLQAEAYISAVAIEVQNGRCGLAVFVEEEQQLLLCEDLPCDFAFDDRNQPPEAGADDADAAVEHQDDGGNARPASTFGHPSYGVIESCEHIRRTLLLSDTAHEIS